MHILDTSLVYYHWMHILDTSLVGYIGLNAHIGLVFSGLVMNAHTVSVAY